MKFLYLLLGITTLTSVGCGGSDDDTSGPTVEQTTEFGKVEANVDGRRYESTFATGVLVESGFPGLTVTSAIGNNEENISILVGHTINATVEAGTYTFRPNCIQGGGRHCIVGSYVKDGEEFYNLNDDTVNGSGTVTMTFYERSEGMAATGTFSMELTRSSDGNTIMMTDGKFNVLLLE